MSPDLVDLLRRHAEADGEDPWLFARVGWDWQWRSWARVADQAARGAAMLAGLDGAPRRVALAPGPWRAGPDGITALLAALAAGLEVELLARPDQAAGEPSTRVGIAVEGVVTGDGMPVVCRLPAVRGPLECTPLSPLARHEGRPGGRIVVSERAAQAERGAPRAQWLAPRLDEWFVGDTLDLRGRRPILATGACTPSVLVACLEWSLRRGAAWALEPDAAAFADSVAWVRPHVVVADTAALDALATRLGPKGRRRSRLLEVVVADETPPAPGAREELAQRLARRPPRLHALGRPDL